MKIFTAIILACLATPAVLAEETTQPADTFIEKFVPSKSGPWDYFVLHVLGNQACIELFLIYIFGFFVMSLEFVLLNRAKATCEEILRVITITLIVVLSLTVLNGAGGKAEFTPIIGLFGTIVGYMLGASRADRNRRKGEADQTVADASSHPAVSSSDKADT